MICESQLGFLIKVNETVLGSQGKKVKYTSDKTFSPELWSQKIV